MPVTAKFLADWTSFYDAVAKAEVSLKSFEDNSGKVERSLNRMSDSFSGRKIIQEATLMSEAIERGGGITKLTSAELETAGRKAAEAAEKMRALGIDVPIGIQKIADAAGHAGEKTGLLDASFARLASGFAAGALIERGASALLEWGAAAIESASHTMDLADKTGLSTKTIQQMAYVASQTGTSLDAFTAAAFKLGVNLSGGKGSVRDAVKDVGLSFDELRAMRPDEQFDAVVAALERIEDPQKRNRLAVELFGKAAAEILPAIAQGYTDLGGQAVLAADRQLRAVAATTNAWDSFKANTKNALVSAAGSAIMLGQELAALHLRLIGIADQNVVFGDSAKKAAVDVTALAPPVQTWSDRLNEAQAQLAALSDEERANAETAKRLGATTEEITDDFGLSAQAQKLLTEEIQDKKKADTEAEAAAKKHAAALEELRSSGDGFKGTVSGMNVALVEMIKHYLDAGVSSGALVEALGVTATQVTAVSKVLKLEGQEIANNAKLYAELESFKAKRSGDSTAEQIADVARWASATEQAARKAGIATTDFYDALGRLSAEKMLQATVDVDELSQHTRAHFDDMAARAQADYDYVSSRAGEFSQSFIQQKKEEAIAAREAARAWRDDFTAAADQVKEKAEETSKAVRAAQQQMTYSFDLPDLNGFALDNVIERFRQAGETDPAKALQRALDTLSAQEGRHGPITNNREFFAMQKDQILLAQLRQLQGSGTIPGFADGVEDFEGGLAYVHKNEVLVNMPKGTSVIPASRASGGGFSGAVFNLTINANSRMDGQRAGKAFIDYVKSTGQILPG